MTADELGALLELVVKLTPAERQRLLQDAEAMVARRAEFAPKGTVETTSPDDVGDLGRDAGPLPCPRCGLVPGHSDIYCGRCGNRVSF